MMQVLLKELFKQESGGTNSLRFFISVMDTTRTQEDLDVSAGRQKNRGALKSMHSHNQSYLMLCISLNIRILGNLSKKLALKTLVAIHNYDILFLQEYLVVDDSIVSELMYIFPRWDFRWEVWSDGFRVEN